MMWKSILKAFIELLKTFGIVLPEFWKNKQIKQEINSEVIEEKNKNKIVKTKKKRLKKLRRFFKRKRIVEKKINRKEEENIDLDNYFTENIEKEPEVTVIEDD